MEHDFWHQRWEQNQVGFHRNSVNPRLVDHVSALPTAKSARVLVPLCGKSLDMVWLAQRGYWVVGVELSELAVRAFAAEHGLRPEITQHGALTRYSMPSIDLWCGDFLALTPDQLGPIDGYYDRAALVALPAAMRSAYVAQLASLLQTGARGLLATYNYPQSQLQGPPFAVPEATVRALYAAHFQVKPLASYDALQQEPGLRAGGLTELNEEVYALERL
jgi:thiopurine S-methyltransferase